MLVVGLRPVYRKLKVGHDAHILILLRESFANVSAARNKRRENVLVVAVDILLNRRKFEIARNRRVDYADAVNARVGQFILYNNGNASLD